MQFEVFNRKTEKQITPDVPKVKINKILGHISFNRAAVAELGLQQDQHVEFLRFGKDWYVAKGKGVQGYKLAQNGENSGLKCYSRIPADAMAADLKQSNSVQHYYLQKTEHEYEGKPVFELVAVPFKK